ncbi:hypothetical protein EYV94_08455 [Puteibacter caeruleilacunae]|nr:hypothetical protein EYV94_08455 [Puteibacter caeruleilacunae]
MKNILFFLGLIILIKSSFAQRASEDLSTEDRPKIGLVLSGGGAKGFAHVGVLKVIDELGIPIDYIAGTSMGSIIGGFYAIGYSGKDIETMISSQNWENLLSDHVSRTYIPFHQKETYERYALSFPIKPKGIDLPIGIVKGQNVINLFERLSIDYHDETDFKKLPIPFVCVATNIESGEAVVLDKGYLPEALRASMAIPTFFSPVEIDDKLLLDGGMVNNYPVKELVKMGADIVIGVDVQSGPKTKEELGSFVDIINQTVSLMALNEYKKNIDFVDINIKPHIPEYSVGSFNDADSLIARGEQKAREYIDQLKALKQKYNLKKNGIKNYTPPTDSTSYVINKIKIEGLEEVSSSLVLGKLNIETPDTVTLQTIDRGISRIYGSRYFDKVDFKLSGDGEKELTLRIKERTTNRFNVGFHYDSDNNAGVLLNTTLRNKLKSGSRLSFDLKLAEKPHFVTTYNVDNGLKPGLTLKGEYIDTEVNAYDNGDKIGNFDLDHLNFDISTHSIFKESYSFGIGARLEYYKASSNFSIPIPEGESSSLEDIYYTYYTFLRFDTHEKTYYPKSGISLYGEYKLVTTNGVKLEGTKRPLSVASLKFQKAISVTDAFTVYPKFYGRVVWGKTVPEFYNSYVGGIDQTDYFDIQVPFVGLERMEIPSKVAFVLRTDLQFELFRNNYLILQPNVGRLVQDVNDSFETGEWVVGGGITYSYNSLIGPMEISLMHSNKSSKFLNYISLGYWF